MNTTLMVCAAASMGACAMGQTVYSGAFALQDGLLVAEGGNDTETMSAVLSDLLGLYEPWSQTGEAFGAALASSGPLTLNLEPVPLDDAANFGEIGDTVNFNPLATGGVVDIATGGDYIDAQLSSQRDTFEVAFVDVEQNVFRQDFGPVQTNQRVRGGGSSYSISWLALNPWDEEFFAVDETWRTREFTVTITVVPAPSALGLLALGGLACARRRR